MKKTVIKSNSKASIFELIRDIIPQKDLFLTLAYRDFRVRYSQTFLGLTWAFIQPLTTLLVFTVVFGHIAKIDTGVEDIPYPLFVLCGMSCWTYFAFVFYQSSLSVVNAAGIIQKIYFPRIILPLSKAVVGLVDYLIVLLMLTAMLIYSGKSLPPQAIYIPVFILVTLISSLGVGIWVSALTVRYRDFQHVIPFLIQFGLYASPIAYPASKVVDNPSVPDWLKYIYFLNPMAGVSEGMRWCLLDTPPPDVFSFISVGVSLLLFITGLNYFARIEKTAADIV